MKAKLKQRENESRFSNGIHIGKWKDKRDVSYISTEFGNETGIFKNKSGKETVKPIAFLNTTTTCQELIARIKCWHIIGKQYDGIKSFLFTFYK